MNKSSNISTLILYSCGFHMLCMNTPSHVTHKFLDQNCTKCIRPKLHKVHQTKTAQSTSDQNCTKYIAPKPPLDFTSINTVFLPVTYYFNAKLLYGVQLLSQRMISHHIHLTLLLKTSMIIYFYDIYDY